MDVSRLQAFELFADVDEHDLLTLADAVSERAVAAGETIVREGDFGYTVFLIESGSLAVTKNGTPVATLGPGDVFGEIAVEQSGRRTADVTATTESRLLVVLNRDLWRVERRLPEIGRVLRETARRRSLEQQVISDPEIDGE